MRLFKKKTTQPLSPDEFWDWVVAHKRDIEQVTTNPVIFDQLMERGQAFSTEIEFLLSPESTTLNMWISCGGVRQGVDSVIELWLAAPDIDGWRITAFKRPISDKELRDGSNEVRYQDKYRVDAESATFAIQPNGEAFDLTIYAPSDKLSQEHHFAYLLLLDFLLGEFAVMSKLAAIEVVQKDSTSRPTLVELRNYLNIEKIVADLDEDLAKLKIDSE